MFPDDQPPLLDRIDVEIGLEGLERPHQKVASMLSARPT